MSEKSDWDKGYDQAMMRAYGERKALKARIAELEAHIAALEEAAEIEELGAQEAERKEFCPNCEAETPCTHEAELFVCDICGEDFAKYIVSRNRNVSDVSMTRDVLIDIKTPSSIENTNPDYYKQELASRDALIERLIEAGNVLVDQNDMDNGAVMAAEDEWRFLVTEWKAMKGGE